MNLMETDSIPTTKKSQHDVIKWKHFPRYWPFVRESTGHRWIPLTKSRNAEPWYFLRSAPEQAIEQTLETQVIWDAIALIMTSLQWLISVGIVWDGRQWDYSRCADNMIIVNMLRYNLWKMHSVLYGGVESQHTFLSNTVYHIRRKMVC